MVRKKSEKYTELTEVEKEMLHKMINSYQGLKMMSRFVKWLAFVLFYLLSILPVLWTHSTISSHTSESG